MLISKTTTVRWNNRTKKWYQSKGYIFTKIKNIFEVNVEDLQDGSNALVEVQCDGCKELLKPMKWNNYKKCVHEDGKYYCQKCTINLFVRDKVVAERLKNGTSFFKWCYDNLPQEIAEKIILSWNNEINKLGPKDIICGSPGPNLKGYWFKCLDHPEHGSELKSIVHFTRGEGNIDCNKCHSISITHPNLVEYLVYKENAVKYSIGRKENVSVKCPDCGFIKGMKLHNLMNRGFSCPRCSDGIPYPEKFFFSFLEQLNMDFKTQLSKTTLDWCSSYQYDNYIDDINIIVETHGIQHYEEKKIWGSLKEIQENDRIKEQLAKENGVRDYIVLDCRKSELEWIKNSIMKSELPQLINFKEVDIDWLRCHEHACSSIVKKACGLWDSGTKSTLKIADLLKTNRNTIIRYLKQGVKIGWCDYNPKEEIKRNQIAFRKNIIIKVICLTTGEIFNSQTEAIKQYNIKGKSSISACCSINNKQNSAGIHPETGEKLTWMFYKEYIKLQVINT